MLIGDNGKGNKVTLEEEHTTFGIDLIKILVGQLRGTIKQLPDVAGTLYEITFSL